MSSSGQKPGVMIYFDIMEPLAILDMEQRGQLLTAILAYSKEGAMPDFGEDKLLMMAWAMVQRNIDRDDESYNETILRRRYASFCKWEKEAGRTPVSFDEWRKANAPSKDNTQDCAEQKMQVHQSAEQKMPTTTSTTTPTPTTTSTTTPTPTKKDISNDRDDLSLSKGKQSAIEIPTREEVRVYVECNDLSVDPDVFFAYQEKKAWSGVQDWRAELRYWHARNRSKAGDSPGSGGAGAGPRRKGSYFAPTAPGYMSYDEYMAKAKPADDVQDGQFIGINDL